MGIEHGVYFKVKGLINSSEKKILKIKKLIWIFLTKQIFLKNGPTHLIKL